MPSSSVGPVPRVARALVGLFVGALLMAGCDGTGSKRTALYQRLVGTWNVERLESPNQGYNPHPRFESRYSWVRIDFRSDEGGRTYRMTAQRSGDSTTTVLADGLVGLRNQDLLRMVGGFEGPSGASRVVTWTFGFETTTRAIFRLPSNQSNGSRAFMNTLLPTTRWSEAQGVRMELARVEESG